MWGWVPQVYYDFLARVVPGAVLVLGSIFVRHVPPRGVGYVFRVVCEQEHPWVCRVAIGLLGSYLVGLVLGELGELIAGRALERRDREQEAAVARECIIDHAHAERALGRDYKAPEVEDLPDALMMSEQLSLVDPGFASGLLRLRAERRLCLVLVLGFALLAVANILAFSADLMPRRLVTEAGLIVLSLIFWRRASRLHHQLVRNTCLGWLLNASRGKLTGSAA